MKASDTTWTTKDGRKVKIREMDDDHLKNVIRLLERRAAPMLYAWQLRNIVELGSYLDSGPPDGAYDCASTELFQVEATTEDEYLRIYTPYLRLVREARVRFGVRQLETFSCYSWIVP